MTGQSNPSHIQPAHKCKKKFESKTPPLNCHEGLFLFSTRFSRKMHITHALFLPYNSSEPSPIIFPCFFPPRLDRFPWVALHCGPPLCLIFLCNAARNRNALRSTLRLSSTDPCGCLSVSCANHPSGHSSSSHRCFHRTSFAQFLLAWP